MAVSLKHAFQSAKADGGDTTLVQPSNWNAEHSLSMATSRLLGRTTAGAGAVEELTVGTGLTLSAGSLSNGGVLSFDGGTTGLTPAVATTGAITLGGTLAIANGGTNATTTPTAGAVAYGTGTAYAFTSAGTAGQVLVSNGTSAPTFGGINGGTF